MAAEKEDANALLPDGENGINIFRVKLTFHIPRHPLCEQRNLDQYSCDESAEAPRCISWGIAYLNCTSAAPGSSNDNTSNGAAALPALRTAASLSR